MTNIRKTAWAARVSTGIVSQALLNPARMGRVEAVLLIAFGAAAGCDSTTPPPQRAPAPPAAFVGNGACASCHAEQYAAWTGSHHELAMQPADAGTVLGDFTDTRFAHGGTTSTFRRSGDGFVVRTTDPTGRLSDYRVAYTFGIDPLQQYLLEMPDGRLQAFTVAWDTRPAVDGGQRWFDLHRDEPLDADDPLHWSGSLYNWNSSCAECHSTDVDKHYDPESDTYATTFSSVQVGCEACHGAASNHVAAPAEHGLELGAVARRWILPAGADIARRALEDHSNGELEICARCHSRRSQLASTEPGAPLLDGFRPALLSDPLYHADGQIRDEVFVYGSFLQSPMHAAGVACSDCHDPHSGQLRAEGNAVCGGCHRPSTYDTPEHHHHTAETPGARCVSCHMREATYMVVDGRRDHSFRVPRPDLSVTLGAPNACADCHEQSAAWAAERVAEWYPQGRSRRFHYAEALHAGRNWTADRGALLRRVIADAEMPAIARATALDLLSAQIDTAAIETIRAVLDGDAPALVQLAALDALGAVPVELRADLGQRFLTAPRLALRLAAAEALLPARAGLSAARRADLDAAVGELRASRRFNADRPEALLGLASLQLQLGRTDEAETTLRTVIQREPAYAPSYVNLADLYRSLGREDAAERVLRDGLAAVPDDAALHHALGLALVRAGRSEEALPLLSRATELDPDDPNLAYVHGVALNSLAGASEALQTLSRAHERFPGYTPTLVALATMHRDAGNTAQALHYARALLEQSPANATGQALIAELE